MGIKNEPLITAAALITLIETATDDGSITQKDRSVLLKDMNSLLDDLNDDPIQNTQQADADSTVSIRKEEGNLCLRSPSYERIYTSESTIESRRFTNKAGRKHREGDKPAFMLYEDGGNILSEQWWREGKLHRDGDKPSMRTFHENGNLSAEVWLEGRYKHRSGDKPALIRYHENGKVYMEEWCIKGEHLREDLTYPVEVIYSKNGMALENKYFMNGQLFILKTNGGAV